MYVKIIASCKGGTFGATVYISLDSSLLLLPAGEPFVYKNSSGDEIANVNFFYNIAHVEASDYAH